LREQCGGRSSKILIKTTEAAHCVNPFLNFTRDDEKIELTYSRDLIIPSPLGMRSYKRINLMLPTLGQAYSLIMKAFPCHLSHAFLGHVLLFTRRLCAFVVIYY
jgi:hypothetical protein